MVLEEVTLEIVDFCEGHGGGATIKEKWEKVKEAVEKFNRPEEEEEDDDGFFKAASARVHVVISDRAVREIGHYAFNGCVNLWKISAPFVEKVGRYAFYLCKGVVEVFLPNVNTVNLRAFHSCVRLCKVALPSAKLICDFAFAYCFDLRNISFHPEIFVGWHAFSRCLSLEVLAASADFEVDTGGDVDAGNNAPTVGITRYIKWRNESDFIRKECLYTYKAMITLCEHDEDDPSARPPRAEPTYPVMKFLVGCGEEGILRNVLCFCLGETWGGRGHLRSESKGRLLDVALELKALKEENNYENEKYWGVRVDENGGVHNGSVGKV